MDAIFSCFIQITIITALAWLISKVFMKHMPHLSVRLSLIGIVLSAVTLLAAVLELPRFLIFETAKVTQVTEVVIDNKQKDSLEQSTTITPNPTTTVPFIDLKNLMSHATSLADIHVAKRPRIMSVLGIAVLVVCLVMAVHFVLGFAAIWQLRKTSQICDDPDVQNQLENLITSHDLHFPVSVQTNSTLSSPCVTWLSPGVIYMPAGFTQWTQDERSTALAHELAHIVRDDAKFRLLSEICLVFTCFHPLTFLLKKQLVFGQEAATDRKAAELLGSLQQYLAGLARLTLRIDSQNDQSFVSVGVSISRKNMIRRIKMLNSKKRTLRRWQEFVIVAMLVASSLGVATCTISAKELEALPVSVVTKSTPTTKMFQRKKTEPWKNIGHSNGYLHALPQVMNTNIWYLSNWTSIMSSFVIVEQGANPAEQNVIEKITPHIMRIELGVGASLFELPKERQQGEEKHQWQFGTLGMKLSFDKEYDWKTFAKNIAWHNFDSTGALKWNFEKLRKSKSITFKSQHFTSDNEESRSEEMKFIEALWKRIDGGALGIAFRILGDYNPEKKIIDDNSSLELHFQSIAFACEAVGFGFDREEKGTDDHIRLVLVPREDQTAIALKQRVEKCFAKLGNEIIKAESKLTDKTTKAKLTAYYKQMQDDISTAKVDIEKLEGTGYRIVTVSGVWRDSMAMFE